MQLPNRSAAACVEDGAESDDFGVELADELPTTLQTMTLTEKDLAGGNTLSRMNLPAGSLVMMVRRRKRYMVPNGSLRLKPGDVLLIISESNSPAEAEKP